MHDSERLSSQLLDLTYLTHKLARKMIAFKISALFALMMNTCSSLQVDGSGSGVPTRDNELAVDYPVMVPEKVLKELVDISDNSKGLLLLWKNSFYLTNKRLLEAEYTAHLKYKMCREVWFHEVSNYTVVCQQAATCLKRSQLVFYYNELVIQLRIAETLINTSISREIQERWRTQVENRQRKIIKILRENILPLMDVVLNATDDEVDCNSTERIIVSKETSLYSKYCAAIQTANFILSQTTLDLYRFFNSIYMAYKNNINNHTSTDNEMTISDYDETKVWCILLQ